MPTVSELLLCGAGFCAGAAFTAVGVLIFRPRRFRFDCRIHPLPRRPR